MLAFLLCRQVGSIWAVYKCSRRILRRDTKEEGGEASLHMNLPLRIQGYEKEGAD